MELTGMPGHFSSTNFDFNQRQEIYKKSLIRIISINIDR